MDIGCVYLNKKRKSREEMKKELAAVGHDKHGRQFLKESLFFIFVRHKSYYEPFMLV